MVSLLVKHTHCISILPHNWNCWTHGRHGVYYLATQGRMVDHIFSLFFFFCVKYRMYPLSSWILSCRIRWPYEVTVCSISGCHYINPYHAELIRVPTQVCAFMKPAGVDTVAFLRRSPCFRHHLLELRQRMQTGGHSFSVNWEMC